MGITNETTEKVTVDELAGWVRDAAQRLTDLVADLDDEQLIGPRLAIINPLLWEIGHVTWFQESFVLRRALTEPPIIGHADAIWDSGAIPHDTRWSLRLPSREEPCTTSPRSPTGWPPGSTGRRRQHSCATSPATP